jgi:SAM-dependent methyltransferase
VSKYTPAAERWSETQYADAVSYLRHRAELIVSLGPPLTSDDTLLDLACGDGGLAAFLPCRYVGVDADEAMVDAARRRGVEAHLGDLNDFEPDEPVAATSVFRAVYYARDRLTFFRTVAGYTTKKLVFDLNPRQYRLEDVCADLRRAGFDRIALRPFFVPQTVALPAAAAALLRATERTGPFARLALRFRFTYVVAASR